VVPENFSGHVQTRESGGGKDDDDVFAVGCRGRVGLGGFEVTLGERKRSADLCVPDSFARPLVEGEYPPAVFDFFDDSLTGSGQTRTDRLFEILGDRGGNEDAVSPDHRTRVGQTRNLGLPQDAVAAFETPGRGSVGAIADAIGIVASETRPMNRGRNCLGFGRRNETRQSFRIGLGHVAAQAFRSNALTPDRDRFESSCATAELGTDAGSRTKGVLAHECEFAHGLAVQRHDQGAIAKHDFDGSVRGPAFESAGKSVQGVEVVFRQRRVRAALDRFEQGDPFSERRLGTPCSGHQGVKA
jgi:hypothetical protein